MTNEPLKKPGNLDDTTQQEGVTPDTQRDALDETIVSSATFPEFPGYKIERELGRGSMGIVYEAIQTSVGRRVALKTIVDADNVRNRERFRAEAEAVAQLQHPNIVQLYDFGEVDGSLFFSLELVNGGSLDQILNRNRPTPRQAAEWIETLARAIQFAHDRHIVHRDLKPSNVLLTNDGSLKISDFGLAKRIDNDSSKTRFGDIVGTPHYMSPEQALGQIDKIGPATDTYALGAILYDLLVGKPPFSSDTILETLHKVRMQDPEPPRNENAKVHVDLDTICMKCLQKETRHRYHSTFELAEDLRRFLDGEPVLARPIGLKEKLVRKARRSPLVTVLLLTLFVVGMLSTISLTIFSRNAKQAQQEFEQTRSSLEADRALTLDVPLGLTAVPIPSNNPLTVAKVSLGKQLFFDKRLSLDSSLSCATCHNPALGWGEAQPVATGIGKQKGNRNTPSIVNTAHQRFFFWDGRAENFEQQALGPLLSPIEMGIPSAEFIEERLSQIEGYVTLFDQVFEDGVTAINVSKALAAFERTIMAGNTPFDRAKAGDASALSESATRGMKLFFNKAHCSACHVGAYLSDGAFHNIGLASAKSSGGDVGREKVTGLLGDRGAFKTPSLREVARTAPYMHDGSLATLEDVVAHYNGGGNKNAQQDEEVYPLDLTESEKRDLVTFLKEGLASPEYPYTEAPELP